MRLHKPKQGQLREDCARNKRACRAGAVPQRPADGTSPKDCSGAQPVFFRLRADVERQLARWSLPALRQIQAQLLETEAAVKRTGTPAELLTRRLFMRIAALANRQARR